MLIPGIVDLSQSSKLENEDAVAPVQTIKKAVEGETSLRDVHSKLDGHEQLSSLTSDW